MIDGARGVDVEEAMETCDNTTLEANGPWEAHSEEYGMACTQGPWLVRCVKVRRRRSQVFHI